MLMMSRKKTLNPQVDVILRNEAIQRVTKAKFLGVNCWPTPKKFNEVNAKQRKMYRNDSVLFKFLTAKFLLPLISMQWILISIYYPEWQHRQGGCIACWRLKGRFPAEAAPIYTGHEALSGHCPWGWRVTASQLDLQSLTPLSVARLWNVVVDCN